MNGNLNRSWTDDLSAVRRVEAVALTVDEPRTANWIASEAEVAHETAAKYLKQLTDDGKMSADTHGQRTMYEPDPVGEYLVEMRELYDEHSPDELAASLEQMNEQIRTWRADYDVETSKQLRASPGRTEDVTDEPERRQVAREWDHLEMRRRLVEDALRLYDRSPDEQRSAHE